MDRFQEFLLKVSSGHLFFIFLKFAVHAATLRVMKLEIYNISYRSLKRIYLSPVSGKILKWISKKHHRSCCLSSKQNQIPKIV